MGTRLELQTRLETILGSHNVYFQPPESVKMHYPAIRYSFSDVSMNHADNMLYKKTKAYQVILIDDDPDSEFVDSILMIPYCTFDRQYASDNLNHFVFTLYY